MAKTGRGMNKNLILPITGGERDPLIILAYMLYHDDPDRRDNFILSANIHDFLRIRRPSSLTFEDISLIHNAVPLPDLINKKFYSNIGRGLWAGAVLSMCLAQKNIQENVSMNKAITALGGCIKKNGNLTESAREIKRHLSSYKPVAHLWAVSVLYNLREDLHNLRGDDQYLKEDHQYFPIDLLGYCELPEKELQVYMAIYVALAEEIRLFGETTVPIRSPKRQPLLNAKNTWRIPPNYPKIKETEWAKRALSEIKPTQWADKNIESHHFDRILPNLK